MKHVEIGELVSAVPVKIAPMTRSQKLTHWAGLIRQQAVPLHLMHGLEYLNPMQLVSYKVGQLPGPCALGVAASDPVLQAQGLTAATSLGDAMRFFELTLHETHAFSCDCGGHISNEEQARRIERLVR